jgi:hypothetical protein
MNTPDTTLAVALDALDKGLAAIPIVAGTKTPAVKWKEWQTKLPSPELLRRWFSVRRNIAVVTTGMVVFDVDDMEKVELVLRECGDTPHKVKTPRGIHLGYRKRKGVAVANAVNVKGLRIDIRTDGGLEVIPVSQTGDGAYSWFDGCGLHPVSELPVARIGFTRQRTKKRVVQRIEIDEAGQVVRRARAYLAKVEPAVSGQGGHNATFRAACLLVQKFGLTFEQAWPLLKEWNERCEPPWSDAELRHKLKDALKLRT